VVLVVGPNARADGDDCGTDVAAGAIERVVGVGVARAIGCEPGAALPKEPIAARANTIARLEPRIARPENRRPLRPAATWGGTGIAAAGTGSVAMSTGCGSIASKSNRQCRQKRNAPIRAVPHCGQNSPKESPNPVLTARPGPGAIGQVWVVSGPTASPI